MDQADRLRALAHRGGAKNEPRIISITSGKGGVGKTNIAVNLAVLMARRGLKTLLVDADFGLANANLLVGCSVGKTIDDVMFHGARIEDTFVPTQLGFDLLPSSSGFRKMLSMDSFTQRALFDQLESQFQNYEIVIYDTAPGLGDHVLCFNTAAHDIVVVAHPEPTALADAYALIKVLATEKREKKFKLLVNRVQNSHEGLDSFRRLTGVVDEFLTVSVDFLGGLPEDINVARSVRMQRPVALEAPRSGFSLGLERIGDKLLAGVITEVPRRPWDNGVRTEIGRGGAQNV